MPQYMLLLRDDPSVFADLSPEEMQKVLQRYGDWRRSLPGRIVGGHKLKDGEGRVMRSEIVSDRYRRTIYRNEGSDGRSLYSEAADYDQAVEVAKTCPHLDFGSIEVRQIERS